MKDKQLREKRCTVKRDFHSMIWIQIKMLVNKSFKIYFLPPHKKLLSPSQSKFVFVIVHIWLASCCLCCYLTSRIYSDVLWQHVALFVGLFVRPDFTGSPQWIPTNLISLKAITICCPGFENLSRDKGITGKWIGRNVVKSVAWRRNL